MITFTDGTFAYGAGEGPGWYYLLISLDQNDIAKMARLPTKRVLGSAGAASSH